MATLTDRTGTVVSAPPLRDINDKDRTQVVTAVAPGTAPARGVASPVHGRARSSFFATLALIFGVGAVFTVFTGVLPGPAIVLGLLAAFFGLAGMATSSRPHVAGKGDALLGMFFGLGALVLGVLALTHTVGWLGAGSNPIGHAASWLHTHVAWMFPSSS